MHCDNKASGHLTPDNLKWCLIVSKRGKVEIIFLSSVILSSKILILKIQNDALRRKVFFYEYLQLFEVMD